MTDTFVSPYHGESLTNAHEIHDFMTGDLSKPHSMGTSIMGIQYDGGVVMGADSRTTTGAYIANRVSDKITPVHERIYCCRSGSAADTQAISDYVKNYLGQHSVELGDLPAVRTAAKLFQQLCYHNKGNLLAGIIVGGWDKKDGGSIYNVTLGGSLAKQPFAISGSGSGYIYGYCDANYRENMTREEARQFAINALSLAMARDGSSGGVIRLCIIDSAGVTREMIPGDQLPVFYEKA
eukprot:TRINITY_DN565_c0_g1_i1.p1 TRINITY_DN565_c0_g1~~TRINITY_DN565_c0_g1_i1.p1  ORF type:complete len:237 (-),score=71.18 TRINITY_DN565_c0_g1_i1:84-794(-)